MLPIRHRFTAAAAAVFLPSVILFTTALYASAESAVKKPSLSELPLAFEPLAAAGDRTLQGPRYVSRAMGYTLSLTGEGATIRLPEQRQAPAGTLHLQFGGANRSPGIEALERLPGVSNYFRGSDPRRATTQVPQFGRVRVTAVYPGINVEFYGQQRQLEYDFVVAPGADASAIRIEYTGSAPLQLTPNGDLVLNVAGRTLRQHQPVAFQLIAGQRVPVASRYTVQRNGTGARIALAQYDRTKPLVIDPTLVYSTDLGGSGADAVYAIATDSAGDAYVAGTTQSIDFPTTGAAYQSVCTAPCLFVSKLNPAGTALLYSTYLSASSGTASIGGIAVDAQGNAYVTGAAASFPVTSGAWHSTTTGGYLAKLSANGSSLVYSTGLDPGTPYCKNCGTPYSTPKGVAVDAAGNAYVTGSWPGPTGLPTTSGSYQPSYGGGTTDAFVIAVNPSGTAPVYVTYLGGSSDDVGTAIAVDTAGDATVTGTTKSADFPVTANGFQRTLKGSQNGFVARLTPSGATLTYSTYLGGSGADAPAALSLDASANAYVTGTSSSIDFPTTAGVFQTAAGPGFLTKVNASGSALVYSTYLPGYGRAVAVDTSGNAYVGGQTDSTTQTIPITPGAALPTARAPQTAFVLTFNSTASVLTYGTYLGGSVADTLTAMAIDPGNVLHIGGFTSSVDFPTSPGVLQPNFAGGGTDSFVAAINMTLSGCTYGFTPASFAAPVAGGSSTVTISAPQGCTYTAVSSAPWVAITSTATGSGTGNVSFSVAGNNSSNARAATIVAGGVIFPITQSGIACTYALTPGTATIPVAGGAGSIALTGPTGCTYSATSSAPFVTITSGGSGGTSGTLAYSVTANNSSSARTATITVNGQTFTISQAAAACTYALSPTSQTFSPAGGVSNVTVTAPSGCTWTAVSNVPWITVTSGSGSGSGSGTVQYTVAADAGSGRTGTLTIAGLTFTVTQGGQQDTPTLTTTADTALFNSYSAFTITAGTTTPQTRTITLSGGVGPLSYTSTVAGTPLFLTATPVTGTTPQIITLTANPTGLAAGTYVNTVTFATAGGTGTSYTVTLIVQPAGAPTAGTQLAGKVGIYRASSGLILLDRNADGVCCANDLVGTIGQTGDIPLAGDWVGDGVKRFGLYRPASGLFLLDVNDNGAFDAGDKALVMPVQAGDVPVVGDWIGSGVEHVGIYRNGIWYLDTAGDGSFTGRAYLGQGGDIPLVGNWSGVGTKAKVGIYRPTSVSGQPGNFFIVDSNGDGQYTSADQPLFFLGQPGDVPILGDWSGDGKTKVGIFRPSNGLFILDQNGNYAFDGPATDKVLYFAPYLNGLSVSTSIQAGDIPVTGNWAPSYTPPSAGGAATGQGKTRTGIFRPGTGTFFLDSTADGTYQGRAFLGQTGDLPVGAPVVSNGSVTGVNGLGNY